jgi:Flp pilus assembly protein TadD/DNA-binding NarL/FixJ family response regulator
MGPSRDGVEPTVLLVGAGERFTPAFQAALARYRVQVETTELGQVVDAVIVTAPDLVLLMGEAAKDGGAPVLQKLAGLSQNFTVPVVVLHDDSELDDKLSAFRHGATAVLPRSASVDATAEQVAKMAREIPEQGSESQAGALGEATLDEFIGALSRQLRSGLVSSLGSEGADSSDLRLTLGRGRPLTEFLDTFVRRVRRHVVRAEPLLYELGGAAPPDALGPARTSMPAGKAAIQALRVVLADDNTPRADAVAQELRARGVTVVVTDLSPSATRFQTLRQADPTVFVIGEDHAHGSGYDLLRGIRRDSRLRWASLLVVRWEEIWSEERGSPTTARLESTLAGLVESERALFARAETRVAFDTRLETTGPARCLRTLEKSLLPLRIRVENPRVEITVDLSDGLIVGAEGKTRDLEPRPLSGVSALSALLVLGSGRVHIEPVDQPAYANVMTPVEAALNMADAETPPISPSIPAAGTMSLAPPRPNDAPAPASGSLRPAPIVAVGNAPAQPPRPAPVAAAPKVLNRPAAPPPPDMRPRMATPPLPFGAFAPPPVPTLQVAPTAPAPVASVEPAPTPAPAPSPPPVASAEQQAPALSTPPNERNPPAMTLPAPLVTTPVTPASGPLPKSVGWHGWAQAFMTWFAAQDAKVHGKRISRSTAAVLVGLGALQGLGIVTVYAGARWLARPSAPVAQKAAARDSAPESAQQKAAVPAPEAAPVPSAAPPVAPVVELGKPDGSGRDVPDCDTLLRPDPPHAGYYPGAALKQMRAGRVAIVRGDLPGAQTAMCRAARYNAESAQIALELSLVLLLERDGAEALLWARRAVELDPKDRGAKDALGDALARMGVDREARAAYIAASGIESEDERGARALLTRAMKQADLALRRGDYLTAERGFRRAAVLEPKSSSAASGLSYALLQLGDTSAGVAWARRAVALSPRSSGARLALGDALAKTGDKAGAVSEWRESSLLDPGNREAQKRLRAAGAPPT